MIKLINITKKYNKKIAVDNINLTIKKNKITMLIGPSGCGKTTTLKMINRLINSTKGDILINGKSIYKINPVNLRRSIGYVIQNIGLFPHMNVYDNIAVVPRLLKWENKKIKSRVEELLDLVTLNISYKNKFPLQLSGGEQQRVGLARALAADPEILLMDEPFGAIDPINRNKLHDSFISIQEKIKKTIVFVTHDINEAIKLGNNIAILNQGKLIQYNSVKNLIYNPKNEFVENLLGHDRSIKILMLKKNKNFIRNTGYKLNNPGDKKEKIYQELLKSDEKISFIIDNKNILQGMYILEHQNNNTPPKPFFINDPVCININNNLHETFSLMIESGESILPVISDQNQFIGIIKMEEILTEFKKKE